MVQPESVAIKVVDKTLTGCWWDRPAAKAVLRDPGGGRLLVLFALFLLLVLVDDSSDQVRHVADELRMAVLCQSLPDAGAPFKVVPVIYLHTTDVLIVRTCVHCMVTAVKCGEAVQSL